MLTDEQLQKLEPFTKNVKFGKLLSDAIGIWKKENINPAYGSYGLNPFSVDVWECDASTQNHCCLVGAAHVGKPNNILTVIEDYYDLTYSDVRSLEMGFDNRILLSNGFINWEAYKFALNVREILMPMKFIPYIPKIKNSMPKKSQEVVIKC